MSHRVNPNFDTKATPCLTKNYSISQSCSIMTTSIGPRSLAPVGQTFEAKKYLHHMTKHHTYTLFWPLSSSLNEIYKMYTSKETSRADADQD